MANHSSGVLGRIGPQTGATPPKATEVMCPVCGHRLGMSIRLGDVEIYCRRCKAVIAIRVEVLRVSGPGLA
jgi:transposase